MPKQHFSKMLKNEIHALQSDLFRGFSPDEIDDILSRTCSCQRKYTKNVDIFSPGESICHTGLILSGNIDVQFSGFSGKEELVVREKPGELIGQAFSLTKTENSFIHFRSVGNTEILFMNFDLLFSTPVVDPTLGKLSVNLMRILAATNIQLNKKICLLTQKSLRDKLLLFFEEGATMGPEGKTCRLSLSREELAAYISAERSSVCRELGRMQDDGCIRLVGKKVILATG